MSFTMEEFKKELYDTALITVGATAVGFAAKKAVGTQLGTPETLKGSLKLGAAIGVGCFLIKYAEKKKWIPSEIKV